MNRLDEGHEIRLLTVNHDNRLILNYDELELILMNPSMRSKNMVIISVAGTYRRGKSFLLNYFLRYLKNYNNGQYVFGNEDVPLEGFQWRGGLRRVTHGINIWSQPILYNLSNGEQVVVLLMDTEGTQDLKNNMKTDIRIFALSLVLSSLQIYSLSSQFTTSDFEYLRLFTDFAKMLLRETNGLQSLLFLIRDWSFPEDCPFGFAGGQRMFEEIVEKNGQHDEKSNTEMDFLRTNFTDVRTFLMPHPGSYIGSPDFTGCLGQISQEFVSCLKDLCSSIFDNQHLPVKRLFNNPITCEHFVIWLKQCTQLFQSTDPPTQTSVYESVVRGRLEEALQESIGIYKKTTDEELLNLKEFVDISQLVNAHVKAKDKAMDSFTKVSYFGTADHLEQFRHKLEAAIVSLYHKKEKNFLKKLDSNKKIQATLEMEKRINDFRATVTEMTYQYASAMKTKDEFLTTFNQLAAALRSTLEEELKPSGLWVKYQMKEKFKEELSAERNLAVANFERIKAVTDEQIIWKCLAQYDSELGQLLERAKESTGELSFSTEHSVILNNVVATFDSIITPESRCYNDMKAKLMDHIHSKIKHYEDQFSWIIKFYFANLNDTKLDEFTNFYDASVQKQIGILDSDGLAACHRICVQTIHDDFVNQVKGSENQRFDCTVNLHKRLIKRYFEFGQLIDHTANWNNRAADMQQWHEQMYFPNHQGLLDEFQHAKENIVDDTHDEKTKDCCVIS